MRNKEIGGDFFDIPMLEKDNHLFDDASFFISGRSALDFVIKDIKNKYSVKTAALPSWCCDSMIKPFVDNGLEVSFYPVTYSNNKLCINLNRKCDVILKMNYFGYDVTPIGEYKGIVIDDITHNPFSKSNYEYTIGSLRKWAGFYTGGFASCKNGFSIDFYKKENDEYVSLRKEAMKQKKAYLSGETNNKMHLETYAKAEEMLDDSIEYCASVLDIEVAKQMDIDYIISKRRENAETLLLSLNEFSMFKEIKKEDKPMFVPILVRNRKELKKFLIDNGVYCPVHWPVSSLHKLNDDERFVYDHELSLVCDQRYNTVDMKYIIQKIKEFGVEKC